MNASQTSLLEIVRALRTAFSAGAARHSLDVLDPDAARGHYAGETISVDGHSYIHRPLRVWVDLAERLGLRLLTPRPIDASGGPPLLRLTFEPLAPQTAAGARPDATLPATERYGASSPFSRISKLDDPGFVLDLEDALARVALRSTWGPTTRILDLGINRGDEVALIRALEPRLRGATIVGIDHSTSAIEAARAKLGSEKGTVPFLQLHLADVADAAVLDALALGRFDLVVSIGLFQSGALDDRALLRRLVQDHLAPGGSLIIGMPNCRYVDGEALFGARMKNFSQPELGLVIKDIAFYRKYLQQHGMKVFVTGKYDLLVTAIPE